MKKTTGDYFTCTIEPDDTYTGYGKRYNFRLSFARGTMKPKVYSGHYSRGSYWNDKHAPALVDVFRAVCLDASCYINDPDLDGFDANYGDPKAKIMDCVKCFDDCKKAARYLRSCGLTDDQICEKANEE